MWLHKLRHHISVHPDIGIQRAAWVLPLLLHLPQQAAAAAVAAAVAAAAAAVEL